MKTESLGHILGVIAYEVGYQERQAEKGDNHVVPSEAFPLGAAFTAIRHNLRLAEEAWYSDTNPHHKSMDYLRKVAAIIVKKGTELGMPIRHEELNIEGLNDSPRKAQDFDPNDVMQVAEKLYYEANPNTPMDVPSFAYVQVEKQNILRMAHRSNMNLYEWCKYQMGKNNVQ